MGFKTKWARLLFIDRKIGEGSYPNTHSLAKEWEGVSYKTIQRDIDYMRDFHDAPIEYDRSRKGYYYSEPTYKLPAIFLSESELFAFTVTQEVIRQYAQTPIYDALSRIIQKLAALLPEKVTADLSWLDSRFTMFHEAQAAISLEIWEKVFLSLRTNKHLWMEYQTPKTSKIYSRIVSPYHAVCHRGNWYIIGHDDYSEDIRVFAVSRIKKAKVLDTSFSLPPDFDISQYIDKNLGVFSGRETYTVKLRFSSSASPYIKERIWHEEQSLTEHEGGSITLEFPTNQLEETLFWLFSWGEHVKVIDPPELRAMAKERLNKMMKAYK